MKLVLKSWPAVARPADGDGTMAPRSAGRSWPTRRAALGIAQVTRLALVLARTTAPFFFAPRVRAARDGRMVAYLGMPGSAETLEGASVDSGGYRIVSLRCPGGAGTGRLCDVGEFPHIFFPLTMSVDALSLPIRDHVDRPRLRAGRSRVERDAAPPHPAGAGRPPGQPTRPGRHGRRLRRDQPGPRAIPGIQRRWSARATCSRSRRPGLERPLRWPEHWRRFVGHRARVRGRRRSAGGGSVEIVAVPDDEHVTLAAADGSGSPSWTSRAVRLTMSAKRRWQSMVGLAADADAPTTDSME